MPQVPVMFLTQTDILDMRIEMKEVVGLIEKGLSEHAAGYVENPPKPGIHPPPHSFIHAMPAYFKRLHIGGIKWVSGFPENHDKGLPQIIGTLILNDMETGAPLCFMDATWITGARTAAVSAVTAKYCARKDARTLGMVGAGVQARFHLPALLHVLGSLKKVKVFDVNAEAAQNYQSVMREKTGLEITIEPDVESAVKGSDVVVTATRRLDEPIIRNKWFEKGMLGMGLEAGRAWEGEALMSADRFVTDDWAQCCSFDAQGAFPGGLPRVYWQLGEIINGTKKGRETDDERILAINIGLALEDIILADLIYGTAKKRGGYTEIMMMSS